VKEKNRSTNNNHKQQSHTTITNNNHTQQSQTTITNNNHKQQSHTTITNNNHKQQSQTTINMETNHLTGLTSCMFDRPWGATHCCNRCP
jgi:hypothetical protein